MLINTNYYLELARGRIYGATTIHKFGLAEDIDTDDGIVNIWDGMDPDIGSKIPNYTYSTTADITTMSSTDVGSSCVINVQGLDENWDLVVQRVALNGQSPVLLTVPLIRVFRGYMDCSQKLPNGEHVYIHTGATLSGGKPTDDSTVRAIIDGYRAQTQMAMYTVPRGYKLYITRGWATTTGKSQGNLIMTIRTRFFGKVWRQLHVVALKASGSTVSDRSYEIPIVFEGQQDLEYLAATDTNDAGCSAGFHAMLIREDYGNSSPIAFYDI
jgi:hypothetical protein